MSADTCPSPCAETNHPGREHSQHHPQCFQVRGVPDDLPPDLCDCRILRMIGMPDAGVTRSRNTGERSTSAPGTHKEAATPVTTEWRRPTGLEST